MYGVLELIKIDWIPINFSPFANFQKNSTYLSKLKNQCSKLFFKVPICTFGFNKKLVPLSNSCVHSTKHVPIQIQVIITWTPKFNAQNWRTC